jgi:hypothetical protein
MKHNRFFVLVFFVFLALVPSFAAQPQKTVKILAIGNSFSVDAVEQNLYELTQSDGINLIIGNMYIGGCSIERHVKNLRGNIPDYEYRKIVDGTRTNTKNFTLEKALADEQWDYVSFQQCSPLSGKYDSYAANLPELVAFVRARVPKSAKFLLHMTWAYSKDSNHSAFPDYDKDQMKMYTQIVAANKKAAKLVKIKTIIPCGTAIQNARTSFVGDHLNRDGYHLDKMIGRYTAACTWYEAIFKKNVVGNSYAPSGLPEDQKEVAQMSAHQAVRHPFKITQINVAQ